MTRLKLIVVNDLKPESLTPRSLVFKTIVMFKLSFKDVLPDKDLTRWRCSGDVYNIQQIRMYTFINIHKSFAKNGHHSKNGFL